MKRLIIEELVRWREQDHRKPLLIDGARQVGKTYLVDHLFGEVYFPKVHKLDFAREPRLADIFADGLQPRQVVSNLEIRRNMRVDPSTDLLFFDEIGECQSAVDSLKYFADEMPQANVCASGSSIGLLDSFPVGRVEYLELFPMTFEEFVMAAGNVGLLNAFREQSRGRQIHEALMSLLLDYYFVGGMPEAVRAWFELEGSTFERCERVVRIQDALINGYLRDFGKYSGKLLAGHLEAVFRNIPRQLSRSLDGSVQRFNFKNVVEKKRRYQELRSPIDWLEKAKLASKCFAIDGKPSLPLAALAKDNIFKLFMFDVGILGRLLEMDYSEQRAQSTYYKGFIAENFVQNEMRALGMYPTYAWKQARGEIEFLLKSRAGEVIPVEVKSGKRTRSKSLSAYVARYAPSNTLKLIGGFVPDAKSKGASVWPLYDARHIGRLLN